VTADSPTTDTTPTWSWVTGGYGTGTFRYQLNGVSDGGWTETTDETYTPGAALSVGTHTLYVQEQGLLGTWSEAGLKTVTIQSSTVTMRYYRVKSVKRIPGSREQTVELERIERPTGRA